MNERKTRSPAVATMANRNARRKTNPNPNPKIAGPARVRWRLSARHGGRTGNNLAKTGGSQLNWPITRQNKMAIANAK